MLKPKTKDIELAGKKYRLGKLNARTGSYIAVKLAMLIAPLFKDKDNIDTDAIARVLPALTKKEFYEIQNALLGTIQKINVVEDKELPEPVLTAGGTFVDNDLNYDLSTVMGLTVHAIMFNVGDFFGEVGLMNLVKSN